MRTGHLVGAVTALVAALPGLSACSSDEENWAAKDTPSATAGTTPRTDPPAGQVAQEGVGEVPMAQDGAHEQAAAMFGPDEVRAAVETVARVAHIALADCHRWTTGEVDPRLAGLVTPELLARALEELDVSREYGGTPIPSLLSHLPTDDGNGHNEAADVRDGCDDSAPLRHPHAPVSVSVDRGGDQPGLLLSGEFVTEVTFGDTRVGAAQDWTFRTTSTADGWRVADASVSSNVNWFPAPPP